MSSTTEVISHWNTLIENFQTSPQQFYAEVTKAINRRQMPNAKIDRITLKEGHLLSAKREYLRISCGKDFYFAVCGAPFGTGFFISWWLLEPPAGCLASLFAPFPILSGIARALVKPWTYYPRRQCFARSRTGRFWKWLTRSPHRRTSRLCRKPNASR